jgi:hypothetical protein
VILLTPTGVTVSLEGRPTTPVDGARQLSAAGSGRRRGRPEPFLRGRVRGGGNEVLGDISRHRPASSLT